MPRAGEVLYDGQAVDPHGVLIYSTSWGRAPPIPTPPRAVATTVAGGPSWRSRLPHQGDLGRVRRNDRPARRPLSDHHTITVRTPTASTGGMETWTHQDLLPAAATGRPAPSDHAVGDRRIWSPVPGHGSGPPLLQVRLRDLGGAVAQSTRERGSVGDSTPKFADVCGRRDPGRSLMRLPRLMSTCSWLSGHSAPWSASIGYADWDDQPEVDATGSMTRDSRASAGCEITCRPDWNVQLGHPVRPAASAA